MYAQDVGPDGTPAGGAVPMPDTTTTRVLAPGRTPVAARPGGGLYVAYPTGSQSRSPIRLWSVGAAKAPDARDGVRRRRRDRHGGRRAGACGWRGPTTR